ncbi:MAG: hypothetical protein V3S42_04615 [Candidatus Neomarinimicrobiota bacterium]
MKIDLSKNLINIDRKPVENKTIGQILGEYIASKKIENIGPVKAMNWALDLYENKPIDLDKSEFDNIRKAMESTTELSCFVSGQIIECLLDNYEVHTSGKKDI